MYIPFLYSEWIYDCYYERRAIFFTAITARINIKLLRRSHRRYNNSCFKFLWLISVHLIYFYCVLVQYMRWYVCFCYCWWRIEQNFCWWIESAENMDFLMVLRRCYYSSSFVMHGNMNWFALNRYFRHRVDTDGDRAWYGSAQHQFTLSVHKWIH